MRTLTTGALLVVRSQPTGVEARAHVLAVPGTQVTTGLAPPRYVKPCRQVTCRHRYSPDYGPSTGTLAWHSCSPGGPGSQIARLYLHMQSVGDNQLFNVYNHPVPLGG